MFDCCLSNYKVLKTITDVIKELTDEVSIYVDEDGLKVRSMDSSRVCLIHLDLHVKGFESFRVDKDLVIGINLQNLAKILKFGESGDKCILKAQDKASTLQVLLEASNQVRLQRFELKLLEIEEDVGEIDDYDHTCIVKLSSRRFEKTLRDLSSVCDSVTVQVNENYINFFGNGDVGSASVMIRSQDVEDEENGAVIKCKEPMQDDFALKYLCIFSHATALSDTVTLKLTNGLPIEVSFGINPNTKDDEDEEDNTQTEQSNETNKGVLKFLLAPKLVETDTQMMDTQMMM
eukprot:TRINITY_DN2695_c0_g1_i1.p1 TRINITY_DN2695_c0_g1~~TRINITY_DN2695_c0_g1_i1.p1  ORF type:complete len:290 (+),score=33.20 TRINITY_DN2695_c0_g1_i1:82-951(+)